jgi:glycosyltransferase involved in cell wall biosynthesis
VFIRGNFLIPDPRIFWVAPSIDFLTKYLKENPVDLIVSTGPPHSMHLIALGLKNKFDIPWIADFRDPWTDIDFYHKLKLTWLADRKHRQLEKKVLSTADHVVTVSPGCAEGLEKLPPVRSKSSQTVTTHRITNLKNPLPIKLLPYHISGLLTKTATPQHFGWR